MVKNITPTKEQIEAKRSAVTDEFLAASLSFALSISEAERAGDINSVQADIMMDLFNAKLAKLLNGREGGLDARGKTVTLSSVDDIRAGLADSLARIANLGPEGCEECEKHWQHMLDFKRELNKALIVAQAEVIKKEGKVQVTDAASAQALQFMKPEGNA